MQSRGQVTAGLEAGHWHEHPADDGRPPALLGTSREEVAERIREALGAYAEEMTALGRSLPDPVATSETIHAV